MAELKSTTAIGGNIVWHGGNLRFDPQGDTIRYDGYKIFTEHDTPLPGELGNGGTTSAFTKTESTAMFAPIHAAGYVRKDGDVMTSKLTNTGNEIEIQGGSPRLTLDDVSGASARWYVMSDGGYLSFRVNNTSTTRFTMNNNTVNLLVDSVEVQSKTAMRGYDTWLRINDQKEFTDGVYFGDGLVRIDGRLQVGTSLTNGFYATNSILKFQNNNIFHDAYHPNADKWTTARTLTLTGDVSGSVSFDGSANASLSVTVANGSHTHDDRYYTESEADARFLNIAGDSMGGTLKTNGVDINTHEGSTPLRIQRNSNANVGQDDNIIIYALDSALVFLHNNDDDGDGDEYMFRYTSGGVEHTALRFSGDVIEYKGQSMFHTGYHPNADKWTTARTLSLTGDATGSVAIDGSSNETLTVTVLDDSHTHDTRYMRVGQGAGGADVLPRKDTRSSDYIPSNFGNGVEYHFKYNTTDGFTAGGGQYHRVLNLDSWSGVSGGLSSQLAFGDNGHIGTRGSISDSVWDEWRLLYTDSYHPNADKWTTARTLSLTGDVSGSVSIDGSSNESLSVTVLDDSHTHDGRYYTETESDARFAPINGAGYVSKSGDEMTGALRFANSTVYERRFTMLDAVSPQYILLCANSANQDVNGEIKLQRTSGNYQAAKLDIIVSSGSSLAPYGTILSLQSTQANEEYSLVTLTHSGTSYVAIKYEGNPYPDTTSAVFTGRLTGNANSLTVISTATDVLPMQTKRKFELNGDSIFHEAYHPNADKWTTARTLSLTGDATGSVAWDGSANASLSVDVNESAHAAVADKVDIVTNFSGTYPMTVNVNGLMYSNERVKFDGTADKIIASGFEGALIGNADTATWADTVDVNASTSTNYYNMMWHANDVVYGSNGLVQFRPSDGDMKFASASFDGSLIASKDVGSAATYDQGQLQIQANDGGDATMGFHRVGSTACQLRHSSNGLVLSGTTRTNAADLYVYGNVTAYSDARLKTDIQVIDNALDKVKQIRGITYKRTNDSNNEYGRQTGVIAQEVQSVLPEAVADGGEHLSVAYGNMNGLLIESIKELSQTVETLQNELQELKRPWWKRLLRL